MALSANHTSLGDQVSKKISIWVFILVFAIITAIFLLSFFLSRQLFNNQVQTWDKLIPQYTVTSLIDSDYFSIQRDLKFIQSSGLFSSFIILDNQKRTIAKFGPNFFYEDNLHTIQDEGGVIWGYYHFAPDFYHFFAPFLFSVTLFFAFVFLFYFIIRGRIRSALEREFKRFNNFLNEIENVTEKLHEVYDENVSNIVAPNKILNAEQVIINRAISRLLEEIKRANNSLREAILINEQKRFQEELARTAVQVAHDIASPVAVLEAIIQSTTIALQEKDRIIIRNAVNRIRDITFCLLKKAKAHNAMQADDSLSQQLVLNLIHQVLSEKRLQYKNQINIELKLDESSYGLFTLVKVSDFCRVLSNLINNSIEAIVNDDRIIVSITAIESHVVTKIRDFGKGIEPKILAKLGELGATYGKAQGLGMGLYHAKKTMEELGGKIEINSAKNAGTTVELYLPKAQCPNWFVPDITLYENQVVAIIDDDENIHTVWRKRFNEYKNNKAIKLLHFHTPDQLIAWKNSPDSNSNVLYLCDYEFIGSDVNGIDLITQLKINYLSILVTSRANNDDIISNCELHNIKLLPKDMANFVPIFNN